MGEAMTEGTLPLIDHHVHGIAAGELDDAGVEILITEASELPDPGISVFDSQLGFALRRCSTWSRPHPPSAICSAAPSSGPTR